MPKQGLYLGRTGSQQLVVGERTAAKLCRAGGDFGQSA